MATQLYSPEVVCEEVDSDEPNEATYDNHGYANSIVSNFWLHCNNPHSKPESYASTINSGCSAFTYSCAGTLPHSCEGVTTWIGETCSTITPADVEPIYVGHDVCMLGSLAMLMKYNDTSLDFYDIVAYIGIGSSGESKPQKVGSIKFDFPKGGRWSGMALAPRHLGYSIIVGIAKESDTFF